MYNNKKNNPRNLTIANRLRKVAAVAAVFALTITVLSFTVKHAADDFLQQLGILKSDADEKITNSMLGGYLDAYGLKNAKNIALGNRTAVTKDLLSYSKKYIAGEAFKKEYAELKEQNKPEASKFETPEEMRANMIKNAKLGVEQTEESLKKAAPEFKPIFEEALKAAKQNLKDAQDPENKYIKSYAKNYDAMLATMKQSDDARLAEWEKEYPADHMQFIKRRLQQFLDETGDIDYKAQLVEKQGTKYFVNPAYERKSNRWKMAFRAGKEVVEPARIFVQEWINEIK